MKEGSDSAPLVWLVDTGDGAAFTQVTAPADPLTRIVEPRGLPETWDTLFLDGRPLPGIVPADGEWVLFAPSDESAMIEAFRQAFAFESLESRRVAVWHEELHRRLHFGVETISTAPELEVWAHRDPLPVWVEE